MLRYLDLHQYGSFENVVEEFLRALFDSYPLTFHTSNLTIAITTRPASDSLNKRWKHMIIIIVYEQINIVTLL